MDSMKSSPTGAGSFEGSLLYNSQLTVYELQLIRLSLMNNQRAWLSLHWHQCKSSRWSVASLLRGEFPPELHCVCWKLGSYEIPNILLFIVSEICEFHCVADAWYWCRNICTCILLYLFYWLIGIPYISFQNILI